MLTSLRKSTLGAALRMGGFIGWYLTVMYICEQSLRFYRDDTMLSSVHVTFLLASVLTALAVSVILLLLDIEGMLADRILRWLPGIFMAESGIALSLANASTMTAFAAVAGVGSAFGALAVISHLLRVKVGQRLHAVALGLALGGAVRLLSVLLIGSSPTKTSLAVAAAAIGIFAALTVHSHGYSTADGPLVSLAEAEPKKMLSKIPLSYIALFVISLVFFFAHSHIETLTVSKIASAYSGYAALASLGFIAASVIAVLTVRLPLVPMLFVFGAGLSAASAMFSGLPYLTSSEAAIFAAVSYAALACIRAGFYILIVLFSLDRPHPLFYAFLGYTCVVSGELAGRALDRTVNPDSSGLYIILLVLLMPVCGGVISRFMKTAGFTQNQLDHRHNAHTLIRRRADELRLSERELTMLEYIVLDGCGVDELSSKMFFSRNTVRMLLRSLLPKFNADDLDDIRAHFDSLTEDEERFLAEVHAAEEERRIADRTEQAQRRREEKAGKAAARERELAEKAAGISNADIVIGGDDWDDSDPSDTAAEHDEPAVAEPETAGEAAEAEAAEEAAAPETGTPSDGETVQEEETEAETEYVQPADNSDYTADDVSDDETGAGIDDFSDNDDDAQDSSDGDYPADSEYYDVESDGNDSDDYGEAYDSLDDGDYYDESDSDVYDESEDDDYDGESEGDAYDDDPYDGEDDYETGDSYSDDSGYCSDDDYDDEGYDVEDGYYDAEVDEDDAEARSGEDDGNTSADEYIADSDEEDDDDDFFADYAKN